jgi:hypothetical protein
MTISFSPEATLINQACEEAKKHVGKFLPVELWVVGMVAAQLARFCEEELKKRGLEVEYPLTR